MEKNGGGGHTHTDDVRQIGRFGSLHFLISNRLAIVLATAAVLDGVVTADQASIIGRFLPGLEPVHGRRVAKFERSLGDVYRRSAWMVVFQPSLAVRPKFGLLWCVFAFCFGH